MDYEEQRLQNIKKNNEILASLGIQETRKRSFAQVNVKIGRSTVKLPRKRIVPEGPRRRSKRVQGIKADPFFLPDDFKEPAKDRSRDMQPQMPSIQGNLEVEEDGKLFFESLKLNYKQATSKVPKQSARTLELAEKLSKFDVTENRVLKVTPGRSYSLDMSPDSSNILVASGDKEGRLGLWQFASNSDEPKLFQQNIHSDSISSLYFDRNDHRKMYSTSYDGRALIFDSEKMNFTEFYSENTLLFDLTLAKNSIYIANKEGLIKRIDNRTNKKIDSFKCHQNKINSIEKNPVDNNYVVTASLDRTVGVWDLRKLKKEISLIGHDLAISHAAFSTNGNSIVSLCNDDRIHCFGFRDRVIDEKTPEYASYRHNNRTGRWLTRFKLNFKKNLDECFVVGSMDQPRCIEIFSLEKENCKRIMRLRSDYVRSVQSLNIFHDNLDIIASVNASGKVHLWQ